MEKIRIMIVEDDAVYMKLICQLIEKEEDMCVKIKAYSKEEAFNIDCKEIDVALLDLTLSSDVECLGGLEVAKMLKQKGLQQIIMLTSHDEEEIILKAFDAGAKNYIMKAYYKDIPKVCRDAYLGQSSIHHDVSDVVLNGLKTERKLRDLTIAEREVYKLKEKGLSKKEIASKLFKSPETVKKLLKKIKDKINQ